jgi:hypothetical protein
MENAAIPGTCLFLNRFTLYTRLITKPRRRIRAKIFISHIESAVN